MPIMSMEGRDEGRPGVRGMVKAVRMTPELLAEELRQLEEKHGMSSAEFYRRFLSGEMAEHLDFVGWVWLCKVAMRRGLLSMAQAPV
jgi:hypothetical protein